MASMFFAHYVTCLLTCICGGQYIVCRLHVDMCLLLCCTVCQCQGGVAGDGSDRPSPRILPVE